MIFCSEQASCVVGSPRIVKYQLLELLSPISFHHGANFLAAVAVAWHERRQPSAASKKVTYTVFNELEKKKQNQEWLSLVLKYILQIEICT